MAGDREEPGEQRAGSPIELRGTPPEGHEGILDDLGRGLAIAQEAHERPEQVARVPVVGDHERALIAGGDAGHEARVVELVNNRWAPCRWWRQGRQPP